MATVRVRIELDGDCESPRDNDGNLGKIAMWHRRYVLGDNASKGTPQETKREIKAAWGTTPPIALDVRGYDHGNLYMACGLAAMGYPFTDRWDSGWLGWIWAHPEDIRREFGVQRITKRIRERVIERLESELEEYGAWVAGECYFLIAECRKCGEVLDSCGGFIGYEYAKQEAADWQKAGYTCSCDQDETDDETDDD